MVNMQVINSYDTPQQSVTRAGQVLLCYVPQSIHHPFVTWWQAKDNGILYAGHYFKSPYEAEEDFAIRCIRGY